MLVNDLSAGIGDAPECIFTDVIDLHHCTSKQPAMDCILGQRGGLWALELYVSLRVRG